MLNFVAIRRGISATPGTSEMLSLDFKLDFKFSQNSFLSYRRCNGMQVS